MAFWWDEDKLGIYRNGAKVSDTHAVTDQAAEPLNSSATSLA